MYYYTSCLAFLRKQPIRWSSFVIIDRLLLRGYEKEQGNSQSSKIIAAERVNHQKLTNGGIITAYIW